MCNLSYWFIGLLKTESCLVSENVPPPAVCAIASGKSTRSIDLPHIERALTGREYCCTLSRLCHGTVRPCVSTSGLGSRMCRRPDCLCAGGGSGCRLEDLTMLLGDSL